MTRTTVLVVDDEESMRYFLTRALKKKGYEVTAVASGEAAITAVGERARDVALVDLKLPGMDGIEVLAEVKRRNPDTVVILMTGYGTVERALEAMRHGAADFVTKPLKVEDVLEKIEEARTRGRPRRPAAPPDEVPADLPAAAATPEPAPRPTGGVRPPPPRPLVPFLVESAEARGVGVEKPEDGDVPYREASRLFETLYFLELLEKTGGNVSLAARIAGISRPSLHRKITDLGLDVERFRQ